MTSTPSTLRILLPLPVGDGYDYLAPLDETVPVGSIVEVPFGKKFEIGVVWGNGSGEVLREKLKPLGQVLDVPPLPDDLRRVIDWMATYTLSPKGALLKMALGAKWRLPTAKDSFVFAQPDPEALCPKLAADQESAAQTLRQAVRDKKSGVTLLDGVTGSGKTEVYAEAIAEALRQGQQVLVMLPEIAMTAALWDRLAKRFGAPPAAWHSELSDKQKRITWHGIAQGKIKLVMGARSALMLPYANLGLIVVDEEHESSFKQEEGVIYHARDMAIMRGHFGKFPVILSSATPSLETMANVRAGKYGHVVLSKRYGVAEMPFIEAVDLKQQNLSAQEFISEPLALALQETHARGQQSLLFLNRRGYAPLTLCRACGYRIQCPRCSSWLIAHKSTRRLHCHHCDYSMAFPVACPSCKAEGKLAACGPGIERIEEEVKRRLPELKTAVIASDTLKGPKDAEKLIAQIENKEIDVLIGTQIMAKGYHFPRLTLVGVIDADLGLSGGDPRAAEKCFQLLQQVAGRSGRGSEAGHVLLQTVTPENPVIAALIKGDRDAFMETELRERKAYHLPPFARLATITVDGTNESVVIQTIKALAACAPRSDKVRVLGPAPAPFALLRGRHRHRLLVQAEKKIDVSAVLRDWLANVKIPRTLRIHVDIDPYSFL